MRLAMTDDQRAELEGAMRTSRTVRHWKRYQAVLLRAAGTPVAVVAQTLGCSEDSVTNWTHAWQGEGLAGVREGQHRGAARRLDPAAEQRVEALLTSDQRPADRRLQRDRLDGALAADRAG